ncbi:LysE family translocator [Mucilaginibacter gotjawali]|uniref:Leucine efflux protein n=2 Tax=Mucilaginibacter gotjawali TaxID=1550579 RepID=A0A0X8X589_9SPHI|nr:LysE family translocator [Mucilaginibacter gotjawali]MBB3058684.1 threonine/homoserine/homoserine lactone efflux protein [Mucilaginibacter gotjawali]BAU55846.1 Leucine efflux protein [Mucilaginibacter gotjawali]
MFNFQNLYLFFIASLLLNLTPGNDMLYVASRSVSQGIKAGIASAAGIFVGCFVHISAAVLGLSLVISKSANLFQIIKFAGAGYLIYLGIKALLSKPVVDDTNEKPSKANYWKLFKQGIVTNALNPKVAVFFLSFLPQFIDPGSPFFKFRLLTPGVWFAAQGTLVLIIVACILGKSKDFFRNNPKVWRIQEKITGFILIGLGVKIALASQT